MDSVDRKKILSDALLMTQAGVQFGTNELHPGMGRFLDWLRFPTGWTEKGTTMFRVLTIWDQLDKAATYISRVEKPQDVTVYCGSSCSRHAVGKFAKYTDSIAIEDKFDPAFNGSRVLILADDPRDHNAPDDGKEYVIVFCNSHSPMRKNDTVIPANNKTYHSFGTLFWLLARMVLAKRGKIPPSQTWDIIVNEFFPEKIDCKWGADILPPLSESPVEDTCWAQAPVMTVEANFRIEAVAEFPRLSIKHCIDEIRDIYNHEMPLFVIRRTLEWLQLMGVAAKEEYDRRKITKRYKIKGWKYCETYVETRKAIDVGPISGSFRVHSDFGLGPYYQQLGERVRDDLCPVGTYLWHEVMVIGYGTILEKYIWMFYGGDALIYIMDEHILATAIVYYVCDQD